MREKSSRIRCSVSLPSPGSSAADARNAQGSVMAPAELRPGK